MTNKAAEEQFGAICDQVTRRSAETKDQAADIVITHLGADETVRISANKAGREMIEYYLARIGDVAGSEVPWSHHQGDAFGFRSASKPGVNRNAIISLTGLMFAAGLVVKTKYDS